MEIPKALLQLLGQSLPAKEVSALVQALDEPVSTCVRLNPNKNAVLKPDLVQATLGHDENTFLLKSRPLFVADPAFHAGSYYVQEANSTIIGAVVKQLLKNVAAEATVLDLCAAPGGKSTHIASSLRPGDLLVANEVIATRTPILNENLCKWGHGNHIITKSDAKQLGQSPSIFDLIVADMPCSGEGLLRKNDKAVNEWTERNVTLCAERQQRIAADIWPALKEGGFFIYSTCTYNTIENEANVDFICKQLGAKIHINPWVVSMELYSQENGCYRLMPHNSKGEGFFFAILQKTSAAEKPHKSKDKNRKQRSFNLYPTQILGNEYITWEDNQIVYALKTSSHEKIDHLKNSLSGMYMLGTPIGKLYHGVLKPEPSLALMIDLQPNQFPLLLLEDNEVIRYLKREGWPNPNEKRGIHQVLWNGRTLGFANGVRFQWNNLWPMEWRIRMQLAMPETIVE
jgi:16S rRNA C967 or C1407 C5-methylase (RsmB/RsmF family)